MAALGMAALGLDVLPPAPSTAPVAAGGEPAIDLEGPWNTYAVKPDAAPPPRARPASADNHVSR